MKNSFLRLLAAFVPLLALLSAPALAQVLPQDFVSIPVNPNNGSRMDVVDGATGVVKDSLSFSFPVYDAALSPDGATAVVTSNVGGAAALQVVDMTAAPLAVVATIPLPIAFAVDLQIACASAGYAIVAPYNFFGGVSPVVSVDIAARAVIDQLTLPGDAYTVGLSPDGSFALMAGYNNWSLIGVSISSSGQFALGTQLTLSSPPNAVAFSPAGDYAAVAHGGVETFAISGSSFTSAGYSTALPASSVAFSPDGAQVFGGSGAGVRSFDLGPTGAPLPTGLVGTLAASSNTHYISVNQIGVSGDGDTVAYHSDGYLNLFDSRTLVRRTEIPSGAIGGTATGLCVASTSARMVFGVVPFATPTVGATWPAFTIELRDASGDVQTSSTADVTVSLAEGTGSLSGTLTRAAVAGIATFDDLSYDVAQTIRIDTSSDGLDPLSGLRIFVLPRESDLRITTDDISSTPVAPLINQPATLHARVTNAGQRGADANARFFLGDPDFGGTFIGQSLGYVPVGASVVLSTQWTPTRAGQSAIFVLVDNLTPPEGSPADNRASRLIPVATAPEELHVSAGQRVAWPGSSSQVTVTIRNTGAGSTTISTVTAGAPGWLTLLTPVAGTTLAPGEELLVLASLDVPAGAGGAPLGGPPLNQSIPIDVVTTTSSTFSGQLVVGLYEAAAASATVRVVDDATSSPLVGALVSAQDLGGTSVTDANGEVVLGLPPGARGVFAYQPGYIAKATTLSITGGASYHEIRLEAGETLGVQEIVSAPLSTQEILDRGIDVQDPVNNIVVDFVVSLRIGSPLVLPSIEVPRNPPAGTVFEFEGVAYSGGGGGSGGGGTGGTTVRARFDFNAYGRTETWIVIPGRISFLKEFFDAQILVVNNAQAPNPEDVQLRDVQATISLPSGIGLPDLSGAPQDLTILLGTLDAGASASASWVIRGDAPGTYTLGGTVDADLFAFGSQVTSVVATAQSGEFRVTVPKIRCDFLTPGAVQQDVPFSFGVLITNEGERPAQLVRVTIEQADLVNCRINPVQPQGTLRLDGNGQILSVEIDLGDIASGASALADFSLISDVTGIVLEKQVETGCGTTPSPGAEARSAPPEITRQPQSVTDCEGETVSFSVIATGQDIEYQWRKDQSPIPGATQASYTIASIALADGGAYDVVVSNPSGAVTSDAATLTVHTLPTITGQPADRTVCLGDPAAFTVAATGIPAPTFQWRNGGQDIPGATSATLSFAQAAVADAGSYDCVVTNDCGSVTSDAVTLTVDVPPTITTDPSGGTIVEGDPIALSVAAAGTGPLSYQWRKDGVDLVGQTASSLTIPTAAYADAGSYDVVVTNDCGSATSSAAVVGVNRLPVITCSGTIALWSPSHDLVDVSGAFSVDDPDGEGVTVNVRVFSDESEVPETGDGTGRHAPDFKDERGGRGLLVRSERRGSEDGRFYLAVIEATDARGAVTTDVCVVAACPHDQNQQSLDLVLAEATAAAAALAATVDNGGSLPPTGLYEHGSAAPLGPRQ